MAGSLVLYVPHSLMHWVLHCERIMGTWAAALRERRCVVPVTAFYEWLRAGRKRYPVEFSPASGALLNVAGIWQRFERGGDAVDCVALLTTAANREMRPVHDRMPVILGSDAAVAAWIGPERGGELLRTLMAPAPAGTLRLRPMHTRLNHWSAAGDDLAQADWSPGHEGVPALDGGVA